MTRILAVIGSGETSPSMVSIHQELAAAIDRSRNAVILETPYGFQENVNAVSAKTRRYFAKNVGLDVHVLPGLRTPAEDGPGLDRGIATLRQANWVFAGPGSPTYAAGQWRASAVGQALRDRLVRDGVTIFASAAACAIGRFALPVYEIYKVGMQAQWREGIDLLSELGLVAAVIPHFDNTEGGTHDTRYCYVGDRRLRQLEAQLPEEAFILGVDEHTAAIFDLASKRVTIRGQGGLTIRKRGGVEVVPAGAELTLGDLRGLAGRTVAASLVPASEATVSSAPSPTRTSEATSLLDTARACEKRFDQALAGRDAAAMAASILDLEAAIAGWSTDTLESDAIDNARAVLRSLIVRLGTAIGEDMQGPTETAAMVEPLVALREELRQQRLFEVADSIREALAKAGIEVQDTPEGSRWHRHQPSSKDSSGRIQMPENSQPTAVFDIIGTCFSLEKPRQALAGLGASEHALELWFAQSLRDSFAFSHADGYSPLKDVLKAELGRTAAQLGLHASDDELRGVLGTFAELDPRPDLADALAILGDRGWQLLALTMGAAESTRLLLERAGVADRYDAVLSCDSISVTKPNRAVYQMALESSGAETWMVAAHAWDIAGASRAGLKTAFVTSVEGSYLDIYPKPDVVADSLLEAARAMVQL